MSWENTVGRHQQGGRHRRLVCTVHILQAEMANKWALSVLYTLPSFTADWTSSLTIVWIYDFGLCATIFKVFGHFSAQGENMASPSSSTALNWFPGLPKRKWGLLVIKKWFFFSKESSPSLKSHRAGKRGVLSKRTARWFTPSHWNAEQKFELFTIQEASPFSHSIIYALNDI